MEKIELKFLVTRPLTICCLINEDGSLPIEGLVLRIDETGKHVPRQLPKRVAKAFTRSAIDKILSKDDIPSLNGEVFVLDGIEYSITIKKGDVVKDYLADDCSINTYPLLRFLASWYRKAFNIH